MADPELLVMRLLSHEDSLALSHLVVVGRVGLEEVAKLLGALLHLSQQQHLYLSAYQRTPSKEGKSTNGVQLIIIAHNRLQY